MARCALEVFWGGVRTDEEVGMGAEERDPGSFTSRHSVGGRRGMGTWTDDEVVTGSTGERGGRVQVDGELWACVGDPFWDQRHKLGSAA